MVFVIASGFARESIAAESCATTIGIDTTLANTTGGSVVGHSIGQSFVAVCTQIRSIAVWRHASQADSRIGMHLYIVEADSAGVPQVDRVVLDGATLVNPNGDGVHATEFRWEFDPPVVLPRPGVYAFFLRQNPCLGYFDVLATVPSVYPDGSGWESQRNEWRNCELRGPAMKLEHGDLVFEIAFGAGITPTRSRSWGRIKSIYR